MLETKKLYEEVSQLCNNLLYISPKSALSECVKECLSSCYTAIMRAHHNGAGGITVCAAHAQCIDAIICKLYEAFISRRSKIPNSVGDKFCIVALGGYGRSEVCPKSDIDIMFLYDNNVGDELKTTIVDEILYPLWNTGLKLGHSSRTRREAISEARANVITKNSMLDARFLCGSKKVYALFERAFKAMCAKYKSEHFDELMRLKRDRHARYGWTPYLQEPNIKNGVGGLRDAQTMHWKTFLNFGTTDIRELARRRIISLTEYKAVCKSYDFLLRVRNDMHYHFGRENDLLDLETQPKIAARLGFVDTVESEGVETFMQKLYYSFRAIDRVAKTARKRMGLVLPGDVLASMKHLGKAVPRNRKFTVDGFTVYRGEVNPIWFNVFKLKPSRMIRVFAYCQEYGAVPSDRLEVLIKDSRYLIDDSLRASKRCNAVFLKILSSCGNVFPALELMHYWGVLGAFVPEFGTITCMVQHEFYHRYTVDVHTLNTIAQLDNVFCSCQDDGNQIYWDYHKVLASTQSPWLAYLILFMHDIGKGDGIRGHAEVSAEIAKRLLERFGVPDSDAESVLFVIKNHLEMARFWQTHDVEDERAIAKFASIVGTEEHLKYLYVITFCDAMGTSESFWNSYKQSLHNMLFTATLAHLQKEESQLESTYRKRADSVLESALQMPEIAAHEALLKDHIANLPRNYFLFHGREALATHVRMIAKLLKRGRDSDAPIIEWRDDPNRSISRLFVVSRDRSGLFSVLAGVISLLGMDILESKILTRPDGITIDTFYVTGISGGLSENPRARERFASQVAAALDDSSRLDSEINELFYGDARAFTQVKCDVFWRRESGKIILDVRAPDRVGLLYKLARTIHACGYDIVFARINTENKWAQDTFQVSPRPLSETMNVLVKSLKNII